MLLIKNKSVQTLVGGVLWGSKQDAWHTMNHMGVPGSWDGTGADNKKATSPSDAQMTAGTWALFSMEKTNTRKEKWRRVGDKEGHWPQGQTSDGELPNSGHLLASQIHKQLMFPHPFPHPEPLTHTTWALSSASIFTGGVRGQWQHDARGQ